jgi:hypothetical protein
MCLSFKPWGSLVSLLSLGFWWFQITSGRGFFTPSRCGLSCSPLLVLQVLVSFYFLEIIAFSIWLLLRQFAFSLSRSLHIYIGSLSWKSRVLQCSTYSFHPRRVEFVIHWVLVWYNRHFFAGSAASMLSSHRSRLSGLVSFFVLAYIFWIIILKYSAHRTSLAVRTVEVATWPILGKPSNMPQMLKQNTGSVHHIFCSDTSWLSWQTNERANKRMYTHAAQLLKDSSGRWHSQTQ